MTGTAVKSTLALGLEPASSQGRQPILTSQAVALTMSATNQPAGATGIHPYIEIRGISVGAGATITIAGKLTDGVTAVTDTSPSITQANADPDGVFRWCSPKAFGSINASGITASSISGALANSTIVGYGFVASRGLVIPGKFLAEKKLPEFSPPDFRGLMDEDTRMSQLAAAVDWSLESALWPDTDQFFPYVAIANATSPATPATIPASPTSLKVATAFSTLSPSFTLTTQPTSPDMMLQFVIAGGNLIAGTLTPSGTNRNGQAITEVVSITAANPTGTFYSANEYASVTSIAVTGFTGTATCAVNGVFASNPIFLPTDVLSTMAGEWYDGTASHVLSFMAATEWELTYDVEKELKFVLKGEAQDMQETGDRTRALITTPDFATYAQPIDFAIVGWPGLFWLDPINGTGQTTQWLDIITFKLIGKTGQKLYMTANGIQVKNRVGRMRRKEEFEAEIDFTNVQLYSKYNAFQKQIIYTKFLTPYYLGNPGGTNYFKYIQAVIYPRITSFKIEPKDEKVVAAIKGVVEYEPSVGYGFNLSMLNENSPNYPSPN